jgi:adenosylhomocysteine nucleosidase
MIAVTFALPQESSGFRQLLGARKQELVVLHTGVGANLCRKRIGPFLDSHEFRILISSGFAGGVDPSLGAGDLFLAENFSAPELFRRACELLSARVGRLVSTDRVIETRGEREQLAQQNGAAAVDMETEWIARACAAKHLPMLSLRAISDTAAAPFPVPPSVLFDLERQKVDPLKLAAHLVRHPAAIVRLIGFTRQIASTRAQLGAALITLVDEMP